jgi:L-lysine 6-oxidase
MLTDAESNLLVLGGYGNAGGDEPIATFAGADTWHDDISDGSVAACLTLSSGEVVQLSAWVIVGSPKFAPELVNIVTLDDIIYDAAVRYKNFLPDLYDEARWPGNNGWNPEYRVNYRQDIKPILDRMGDYRWVANVPSMTTFAMPNFDVSDASDANRPNRKNFFRYFRQPDGFFRAKLPPELAPQHEQLFSDNGVPLLPLNSGSNSVSNELIDKFMSLTPTQWYLLHQWAEGKFVTGEKRRDPGGVHPLDHASVGNCVGHPMCPGIEVTWSTRNPALYQDQTPYSIRQRHDDVYYREHGLSPTEDETDGRGCEPGDLTKRMAIPWQADFFQCTIQYINFTNPQVNKTSEGIPVPPTYYAYWWPPQSPWDVISGVLTEAEQQLAGVPGGVQVNYARGVNGFAQMITAWSYLGFILNQNSGPDRRDYPYFVEMERSHDKFTVSSVAVGQVGNVLSAQNVNFMPVYYLKPEEENKIDARAAVPRVGGHIF